MITTVSIGPIAEFGLFIGPLPPAGPDCDLVALPEIPNEKTSVNGRATSGRRQEAGGRRRTLRHVAAPARHLRARSRARAAAQERRRAGRRAGLAATTAGAPRWSASACTASRDGALICELCRPRRDDRPERSERRAPLRARATRSGAGPPDRAAGTLPRRGSRQRRDHDRPAARGGLRVPRRHRQPRRVQRPLHGRLAPDARGHLRLRRRRALPAEDAASTASRGATRR